MDTKQLIAFLAVASKLKYHTRHCETSGGRKESVAEHSWRAALMAMLLADEHPELDSNKVIRMCLVHDLGEAITGDIPSFEKTAEDEKTEEKAVAGLIELLDGSQRQELADLFLEIREKKTPEAKLFHAIDKVEAVISHNESSLDSWAELEFTLNRIYGWEEAQATPYMSSLRLQLQKDTDTLMTQYGKAPKEQ